MHCKKLTPLLLAVLIFIMSTSCSAGANNDASTDSNEKYQKQVYAMDTVMILTAYGEKADESLEEAEEAILSLESDLDPEAEGGSVYALNQNAGTAVAVSEDCFNIMSTSMTVFRETNGALDPGLYPVIKAWGFISGDYRVPSQTELDDLLAQMDTASIQLDEESMTITLPAGMEVSFGAAAKGYTAQKVLDIMAEAGVESAIVSLGGNVQTLGDTKPDGSQWTVAVIDPNDTGSYVGLLYVGQTAVVTSGGYQRYFEEDGVTYIHILNPETGCPVDNDLLSLTVVTDDGTRADALSTALFVLGSQEALAYADSHEDVELVIITKDNQVIVTAGLADCFSESGEGYTYEYLG
ncbi:MAG: FAD:protein FMN transferase [Oscillospiraceae bacterium]|nr:FAD:protein FMN transferase [Oscillospiraceae bacterium]